MAQIDIERKRSHWGWLIGLVVLALLVWGAAELLGGDDELAEVEPIGAPATVAEVQPLPATANPPTPVAQAAGIPVSQIIESPATWTGKRVTGEVMVGEVISDRGFWISDQGERLFVLLNEQANETKDINQGQTLRISEAVVYAGGDVGNIPGGVEPQARQVAQGQPVVLATDSRNVEILNRPAAAP